MSDIPDDIRATDFHEWWREHFDMANLAMGAAHEAWDAATRIERERCAKIAEAWDGKPCGPAQAWTSEQRDYYDAGQIDASGSIALAIRTPTEGR